LKEGKGRAEEVPTEVPGAIAGENYMETGKRVAESPHSISERTRPKKLLLVGWAAGKGFQYSGGDLLLGWNRKIS